MNQMPDVTRQQIADGLRQLGMRGGELLMVHSSLSSFGHVEGGPAAVVDALLDVSGADGTVFVPTFNFGQVPYDPANTRSLTGAISENLRTRANAIRSPHPTHPISGIGPQAARLLGEHPIMRPFGQGSPLWRMWKENAQILLLGCDHRACSMIHVAEICAGVPYLNRTRKTQVIKNGQLEEITLTRPPCSNAFNIVDEPLRKAGQIQQTQFGHATVMLMRAADIVDAAVKLMAVDPGVLVCDDPTCDFCTESRRIVATLPSNRGQQEE
jgi:aminoglycoside N3'-acetyltransferase